MVALSIKLPKDLAEMSGQVARRLGITRSELIRQALVHEIEQVKARLERGAMAASLRAMTGTAAAIRENEAHVMLSPLGWAEGGKLCPRRALWPHQSWSRAACSYRTANRERAGDYFAAAGRSVT